MKIVSRRWLITIIIVLFSLLPVVTNAQFKFEAFTTVGKNYTNTHHFVNIGQFSQFTYKSFELNYSIDFNLLDRDLKSINGFTGSIGYIMFPEKTKLKVNLFYNFRPVSSILNDRNWGLKFMHSVRHWDFELGNNIRSYKFSSDYIDAMGFSEHESIIKESWNLMYSIKYNLKGEDWKWNVYLNLTNFERFIIEQEINPMLDLGFTYSLNEGQTKLFADLWYQTAGFNNIRVNYFGYFTRIGILWQPK